MLKSTGNNITSQSAIRFVAETTTCVDRLFDVNKIISSAQTPPPPNGGNNPTEPGIGNTPVGGGAPIAEGLGILLAQGAAYGIKKVYEINNNKMDNHPDTSGLKT